jgi:predicted enzyme related to lactoylglutathione lyase
MLANAFTMATIPAEDLDRAVKFYSDVLGLKPVESPAEGSALFEAGSGAQILIYQRGRSTAQHTAIHFVVENLESAVDGLLNRGVSFEQYQNDEFSTDKKGIATMGGSKMAWLIDPEGNILGLLSR